MSEPVGVLAVELDEAKESEFDVPERELLQLDRASIFADSRMSRRRGVINALRAGFRVARLESEGRDAIRRSSSATKGSLVTFIRSKKLA